MFGYKKTYFSDKYEDLPSEGFTALFENILDYPNICIELEIDALKHIEIDQK